MLSVLLTICLKLYDWSGDAFCGESLLFLRGFPFTLLTFSIVPEPLSSVGPSVTTGSAATSTHNIVEHANEGIRFVLGTVPSLVLIISK